MKRFRIICQTALPLLLCSGHAAFAQQPAAGASGTPASDGQDRVVDFSSAQLDYDSDADIVTVTGEVRMNSEGNALRADKVVWNRKTGEVQASGNVTVTDPQGDVAYGDQVQLTDTLKDGMVRNLLLVLEGGGRLAADSGERKDGVTTLHHAAYTPCAVIGRDGCPKNPSWKITAVEVTHDPVKHRISYKGARIDLFGLPIAALPGLSHPDGEGGGGSGLLVPEIRIDRTNGVEFTVPYYFKLAPNRDLTIAPHVYSGVLPMLEARYRALTGNGAYQVAGYITHGSRIPLGTMPLPGTDRDEGIRGYIEGNGKFQLDPYWSLTASGRYVTDRTFLRRYDISRDDRLRSVVDAERISDDSYISIAGWAFEGLRATDRSGQQPIALPAVDARFRFDNVFWGGNVQLQANSLAILRTEGQDTQRAFASAQWERRSLTPWGQELTLTAFARGDVYHTADTDLTSVITYRGDPGWSSRAIGAVAADLRWPFVGTLLGGTQRFTPRVQVVSSLPTRNTSIPNEDARSVDLEDSNLFALNRFPGYDRWEDGTRITYGAEWNGNFGGISISSVIGQSYRLTDKPGIFPPGTGLSDRFSDFVGRTTLRIGRKVEVVHRFRLDKDNGAIRRNEIDAVVGGRQTYATVGYLRLNRDVDPSLEDLRDREEVRLGGRVRFARYWSLFGSTVIDLTSKVEDPVSSADGYEPVRHRLGIAYDDDCIEIGVTWRRDYETTGDVRSGNSFLFRVALKNLGR